MKVHYGSFLLLFIWMLTGSALLHSQNSDTPGYSFGLSYSGLQYGTNSGQQTSPIYFKGSLTDQNGHTVSGEFNTQKKNICPGFLIHWEFMLFTGPAQKIYHGPSFFVSYQKNEDFGSDMWGLGYFARYKPKKTSPTGVSLGFHFFPQHRFKRDLTNVSTGDSINFYFNGENFGDTVKMSYAEKKKSICPEISFHLGLGKKFELRFCAGYFITLKSVQELKIDSELSEFQFKSHSGLYATDGSPENKGVFTTGPLFFRAGLYMHILSSKQKKK